jgi:hypothetical protein
MQSSGGSFYLPISSISFSAMVRLGRSLWPKDLTGHMKIQYRACGESRS